ncbi:MAG: hypothetical protein M3N09_04520 [Actinomycetota bacterium]|nr:hypothetical protein [Actinomycetota bacterium]
MVNPQSKRTKSNGDSHGSSAPTEPRGRRSRYARVVGWMIVPLYVAGICTSYVLQRRAGLLDDNSVENAALLVGFSAFAVVGALLVAKRPTNAIGWIMAAVAMVSIFLAGDSYAAYVMVTRGQPDALAVVGAWIGSWYWLLLLALVLVYLPLLFPDGRLPSRRWLPVAVLAGIGMLGVVVLGALADTLPLNEAPGYEIDNPIGIEGLGHVEDLPVFGVLTGLLFVGIIGAVASVVVRFRRSRGVERQQMKWFVYAVTPMLLIPTEDYLLGIVSSVALSVVLIGLPTAIGIAVLRYRLYDIDVLINRTLVYGSLTALLVTVYVGSIVVLQAVFRSLTGQDSQLTIVASTLAIAALFNPLHRRIQAFVDRRFYRRKYDAAKTLAAFSSRLRDETDLAELNEELLAVVRETMQPAHVSLWLRPDTASKKEDTPG